MRLKPLTFFNALFDFPIENITGFDLREILLDLAD